MKNMINWLKEEESGQGMVEYALILGLIALTVMVMTGAVGNTLEKLYELIDQNIGEETDTLG